MWNSATITALASALVAIAGAVIAIIHTIQHARSGQAHNDPGPGGPGGRYLP